MWLLVLLSKFSDESSVKKNVCVGTKQTFPHSDRLACVLARKKRFLSDHSANRAA